MAQLEEILRHGRQATIYPVQFGDALVTYSYLSSKIINISTTEPQIHIYFLQHQLNIAWFTLWTCPICFVWFLNREPLTHTFASSTTPAISQLLDGTRSILITKGIVTKL